MAACLVIRRHYAKKDQIMQTITIAHQMKERLDQYNKKLIPPDNESPVSPMPAVNTPSVPEPENIDFLTGKATIAQSLVALTEKYPAEQITLATSDGLLLASSRNEDATADAATYSQIFTTDPQAKIPGVLVFGIDHKGSMIIGSVKAKKGIGSEMEQQIKADTKDILNWWI
jgi:hypothetical protein